MKTIAAILGSALLLSACAQQPEPICDREAQTYDKFGTPEDMCMRPQPRPIVGLPYMDDPHDPVPPVFPPSEPPSEPPTGGKAKGNNGLGNGDQSAPGNSLGNNKAENQVGNPGHKSGKEQRSD